MDAATIKKGAEISRNQRDGNQPDEVGRNGNPGMAPLISFSMDDLISWQVYGNSDHMHIPYPSSAI